MEMHNPPHPGEVLREYMGTLNVAGFAAQIGLTRQSLYRVLNGDAAISPAVAVGIEYALSTPARMWLGMQADYDLWHAREDRREAEKLRKAGVTSLTFNSKSRPGRKVVVSRPFAKKVASRNKLTRTKAA
jgi:addiction module HigA family antidote